MLFGRQTVGGFHREVKLSGLLTIVPSRTFQPGFTLILSDWWILSVAQTSLIDYSPGVGHDSLGHSQPTLFPQEGCCRTCTNASPF